MPIAFSEPTAIRIQPAATGRAAASAGGARSAKRRPGDEGRDAEDEPEDADVGAAAGPRSSVPPNSCVGAGKAKACLAGEAPLCGGEIGRVVVEGALEADPEQRVVFPHPQAEIGEQGALGAGLDALARRSAGGAGLQEAEEARHIADAQSVDAAGDDQGDCAQGSARRPVSVRARSPTAAAAISARISPAKARSEAASATRRARDRRDDRRAAPLSERDRRDSDHERRARERGEVLDPEERHLALVGPLALELVHESEEMATRPRRSRRRSSRRRRAGDARRRSAAAAAGRRRARAVRTRCTWRP